MNEFRNKILLSHTCQKKSVKASTDAYRGKSRVGNKNPKILWKVFDVPVVAFMHHQVIIVWFNLTVNVFLHNVFLLLDSFFLVVLWIENGGEHSDNESTGVREDEDEDESEPPSSDPLGRIGRQPEARIVNVELGEQRKEFTANQVPEIKMLQWH